MLLEYFLPLVFKKPKPKKLFKPCRCQVQKPSCSAIPLEKNEEKIIEAHLICFRLENMSI